MTYLLCKVNHLMAMPVIYIIIYTQDILTIASFTCRNSWLQPAISSWHFVLLTILSLLRYT